jgi:Na+/proline symporter
MSILGLDLIIWIVLAVYFAAMLFMGWWAKRGIKDQEGYLLGNRRFGIPMMIMHAFGAGTNPTDTAGTIGQTMSSGASGIWVSWMWMFGTPFYWLIAPIIRRMRCLTLGDYFEERFGRAATTLYATIATVGMTVFLSGLLLATARTVQGMMGKAVMDPAIGGIDWWFYGIMFATTFTFMIYGYWGGIVAAIRTDMVQGIMIIILSFLALPVALKYGEVGGLAGMRETIATLGAGGGEYLSMFSQTHFKLSVVVLLSINGPLSILAQPHLMPICAAGKTEWEGRVGFATGNFLKRICTIGWSILGLCWLAHLTQVGAEVHGDAAFGDLIRALLSPPLQGLMLACVMAASMSTGDAVQVTVGGILSQNIYRPYFNPEATQEDLLRATRIAGVAIIIVALFLACMPENGIVKAVLDYANILSLVGISVAMGILWRRMNTAGMITGTILAVTAFVITRYGYKLGREYTVGVPILVAILGGVIASLVTRPPDPEVIEKFFKKIYTPIGQEDRLDLPLDEAVPESDRLLTIGGLFVMKPSRQSWVGFLVFLAGCLACVGVMLLVLKV